MNQAPAFTMRDREMRGGSDPTIMVSLPEYVRITGPNKSINSTRWERIMITLKDPSNKEHIKRLNDQVKIGLAPVDLEAINIKNYF